MRAEIIRAGVATDVSDILDFIFLEQQGFGLPDLRRLSERGPQQHGDTDLGFRVEPRVFAIKLAGIATDWPEHEARRDQLLDLFKPSDALQILRVTRDNGQVRQIDFSCIGGLGFATQSRRGSFPVEVVQLKASTPFWYDPSGQSTTINSPVGGGAFVVPMVVPTGVGVSGLDVSTPITNPGSWDVWPRIIITGPVQDLRIENETIGAVIDFDGYTIGAGDVVTIDLRYGYRTVEQDDGTNLIDKLTDDSDLAGWRLGAHPDTPGGVNSIQITGLSADENTRLVIQFNPQYIGI